MNFATAKWSLVGTVLIYLSIWSIRNTWRIYSGQALTRTRHCCDEERKVDISDSRLSNFGSDSGPHLDTEEQVDNRVVPITQSLNHMMEMIIRRYCLYTLLEGRRIFSLKGSTLNLTFYETQNGSEVEKSAFGTNAMIGKLDTLQRIGSVYIQENSNSVVILTQKLRFKILKLKFDYYNSDSVQFGSSSFKYIKNTFLLNVTFFNINDVTKCGIGNVDLTFIPDEKSCVLKVDGIFGSAEFYKKLRTTLHDYFLKKISTALSNKVKSQLTKLMHQADICSHLSIKNLKLPVSLNIHYL